MNIGCTLLKNFEFIISIKNDGFDESRKFAVYFPGITLGSLGKQALWEETEQGLRSSFEALLLDLKDTYELEG